jgi:hypothetical protein
MTGRCGQWPTAVFEISTVLCNSHAHSEGTTVTGEAETAGYRGGVSSPPCAYAWLALTSRHAAAGGLTCIHMHTAVSLPARAVPISCLNRNVIALQAPQYTFSKFPRIAVPMS